MKKKPETSYHFHLSKREREIMDILIQKSEATVADVISYMRNPSSYSSIRTILTIMFQKGFLLRRKSGKKYVYSPAISRKNAQSSAVKQLLSTYFDNSLETAVSTLMGVHKGDLSREDIVRLKEIIDSFSDDEVYDDHE